MIAQIYCPGIPELTLSPKELTNGAKREGLKDPDIKLVEEHNHLSHSPIILKMMLFDLVPELLQQIVSEMVAAVGPY